MKSGKLAGQPAPAPRRDGFRGGVLDEVVQIRVVALGQDLFLHRFLHLAQVDEDAAVRIRFAAQRHRQLVVVAVQVLALPLVARKLVGGCEGELGLDLVHRGIR